VIQNFWENAIFSVTPTILVGLIFWLVMRSILRADRTERKVYAEIEAEERARLEQVAPAAAAAPVREAPASTREA
jgi:hypothetical protein